MTSAPSPKAEPPELTTFVARLAARGLNIDGVHRFPVLTPKVTERVYYSGPCPQNEPPAKRERMIQPLRPGRQFIRLDYGQVEPRILHNILRQRGLIAWDAGEDLYRTLIESTSISRADVKVAVNAIAYGGKPEVEPEGRLKEYADAARVYRGELAAVAQSKGFVETLSGRRISMTDDPSYLQGSAIARAIQGTAADAFNSAVMVIDSELEQRRLPAQVAFLCHDEVWIETEPSAADDALVIAKRAMLDAVRVKGGIEVPIDAEVGEVFTGPAPTPELKKKPERQRASGQPLTCKVEASAVETSRLTLAKCDVLDAIKERVDVRELARELGVSVLKNGAKAHCFNQHGHANGDRNPSLLLFSNGFNCRGGRCGIKGDVFDLLKLVRGMDFVAAKKWLMDRLGIAEDRSAQPLMKQAIREGPRKPVVSEARRDLMRRLYDLVAPLKLTDEASAYLEERGITPALAHELGCRDWRPAADGIRALFAATDKETLHEAGLDVPSDGSLWYPARRLVESGSDLVDASGLAFPAYLPDDPTPMQWRWRFYAPPAGRGKVDAMSDRALNVLPLGLRGSDPHHGITADTIVIAEGEPDYLSFYQAWLGLPAMGHALEVVGLCTQVWRQPWTTSLANAKKVLLCLHKTAKSEAIVTEVILALQELHGLEKAKAMVLRMLVSERYDGNDMLKAGALQGWLRSLLSHAWPDDFKPSEGNS